MPDLDDLLDLIGEAAISRDAWDDVLLASEEFLGARAAQFAVFRTVPDHEFYAMTARLPEIDPDIEDIALASEPIQWTLENPRWRRFVDYDFTSERQMARSRFYEHNSYFDIRYRLGARLVDRPGVNKAIVWLWPESSGHVDETKLQKLDLIQNGLRVAAAAQESRNKGSVNLEDAVFEMTDAAFMLSSSGEILIANAAAEECLRQQTAIRSDEGVIAGANGASRAALRDLIAAPPTSALLPCGPERFPLIAKSISLPAASQFLELPFRRILLTIRDPQQDADLSVLLCQYYCLTAAETDVVRMTISGFTLREIAMSRGTGYETTRSQMKSILMKTGSRSQADLVRRFPPQPKPIPSDR